MISNTTINAISAGAQSLNIVESFSFMKFRFAGSRSTPKAQKSADDIHIPGDVKFTCKINTDGLVEIQNI